MSTILSSIALVFVVNTQPTLHLQIIDRFQDQSVCEEVIKKVAEQEATEPENERIAPFLKCIKLSMRYNPDGDGPSKPVVPRAPAMPMMNSKGDEAYSCWNMLHKPVVCRNTGYTEK